MQSTARTVTEYLASLPADRRAAAEQVIQVVRANADPLLEEGMQYGMVGWFVPHRVFAPGYHVDPRQPLPYACLASQKHHLSLYLMSVYADDTPDEQWFRREWAKSGKKLDMGKSCIRFKRVEDLALDVIGEAFRRVSVAQHLASYAKFDPRNRNAVKRSPATRAPAKKAATKAATKAAPAKRTPARRTAAKKK
jgi:hypothetical protein